VPLEKKGRQLKIMQEIFSVGPRVKRVELPKFHFPARPGAKIAIHILFNNWHTFFIL
jgi:hypothetical protein